MPRPIHPHVLLVALVLTAWTSSIIVAAPTAKQRKDIRALSTSMTKAGNLFKRKRFKESGDEIRDIQRKIENLTKTGDRDIIRMLGPVYASLTKAHALLEQEGVNLSPLKDLNVKPQPSGAPKPSTTPPPAKGEISFVKHIAPILVSKCGRCHVNTARGDFSMSTFATLMKGTPDGVVIFAKDASGSRLIEVLKDGDMPRGGIKISPQEVSTLERWISQGAKYDGDSQQTNLAKLAPNVRPAQAPRIAVTKATGRETIKFSRDIAPVLSEKCANCHGRGRRPSGRFNLNTFAAMLRGGESGAPVLPGSPAESLMIKKLKGTGGGQRMPLRQDALPNDVIAKFEKWISEGAKFDGPDANQVVEQVAALGKAKNFTHEQLAADRAARSADNWRLGMPGIDADQIETKNFLLMGNIGSERLDEYGQRAESVTPEVAALFRASPSQPLIKGRLTLYFFKQRYDYSEFGQMVEKRQLPRSWQGHWRYNVVEAYAALLPPRNQDISLDALIAQQVSGAYVASLASLPPRWFSEGSARATVAKLYRDDPRIKDWDQQLGSVVASMQKGDDFLTGKLSPEDANIASYSFVKLLMSDSGRYNRLIDALRKGQDFNKSFNASYGASVAQVAERWRRSARS